MGRGVFGHPSSKLASRGCPIAPPPSLRPTHGPQDEPTYAPDLAPNTTEPSSASERKRGPNQTNVEPKNTQPRPLRPQHRRRLLPPRRRFVVVCVVGFLGHAAASPHTRLIATPHRPRQIPSQCRSVNHQHPQSIDHTHTPLAHGRQAPGTPCTAAHKGRGAWRATTGRRRQLQEGSASLA